MVPATTQGSHEEDRVWIGFLEDQLILFGGYGYPSGPTQPGAEFIKSTKYTDGSGWTNELHSYSLKEGELVIGVRRHFIPIF